MVLWDNVFFSETLKPKKDRIMTAVAQEKMKLRLYCIALPGNENHLFDIYPYRELLQPAMKQRDVFVIAFASSRKESVDIVCDWVQNCYIQQGDFDMIRFLGIDRD
ncbi:MAG: hypothetical protein ACI4TK_00805 [Agathobacter sp.]